MQIAGYKFRMIMGPILFNSPGIFIYTHQASGMNFVMTRRNARQYRGKNNYPKSLKELLKARPSEVTVFMAELPTDSKEEVYKSTAVVSKHLKDRNVLYKSSPQRKSKATNPIASAAKIRFTVWSMTHKVTGAVYYFEEVSGAPILARLSQRMLTFNNYAIKNIVNANRVMYYFIKQYGLVDISHWVIRDIGLSLETENEALIHITKLSKVHLDEDVIVLNRIAGQDALYYRNTLLKLKHRGIDEYLKKV